MSEIIKVTGGNTLKGEVTPVPNKNSILACLPACILTDEDVYYHNVPKSTDVVKMLEMLRLMGATIDDSDFNNIRINCSKLSLHKVDKELGSLIRASIMFVGPLLARFGVCEIPVPGGCILGKRSISAHIDSFSKVGVAVTFIEDDYVRFTAPVKVAKDYIVWQFEASVTGTENFLMYCAGIESQVEIVSCACEPHVYELESLLATMGATVEGAGSNRVIVKGSRRLKGVHFTPGPDFVDIAGLCVASAITGGNIRIKGANIKRISGGIVDTIKKFGVAIAEDGEDLVVNGSGELLIDLKEAGFPLAGDNLPKFVPKPWPGFPIDALPAMVVLACKTKGRILMQNWMYETGLDYTRELSAMGASIFTSDPQRIIVSGPIKFKGGKIIVPGIIEGAKAVFLASLCDDVTTIIEGTEILKRRYTDIFDLYRRLGANIKEVSA
jgi:UDP-N-acetylglucosamine 1-carboxyvinyltransferase